MLQVPSTEAGWQAIADEFNDKWQFPNCIGAMDGKHVAIRAPAHSGSQYHNYKHFHSIVLLALVDANYKFIFVDVGSNGRACDAGIYGKSKIASAMENNTLNIPPARHLPGRVNKVPYVIIGDEAFPLKPFLIKPYPSKVLTDYERIFNYRLSRARRVSENAFGILVNRFRVLAKYIHLEPTKCTVVTNACIALHNFLLSKKDACYATAADNDQPQQMSRNLAHQGGNRNQGTARDIRDELCDYFNTNGQVDWQWDIPI